MKRFNNHRSFYLPALTAVLMALSVNAAAKSPLPERVQVTWAPNSQLTEIKRNPSNRGWLRPEQWKRMLSDYLRRRANALLPAGESLQVKITDIKLAGDFEPWHTGPNMQDIRFIKDIYPPWINLHFTLTGADGKVIREGDRKLRDLAFLQRPLAPFSSSDPLGYDKRLIRDWLQREFRKSSS